MRLRPTKGAGPILFGPSVAVRSAARQVSGASGDGEGAGQREAARVACRCRNLRVLPAFHRRAAHHLRAARHVTSLNLLQCILWLSTFLFAAMRLRVHRDGSCHFDQLAMTGHKARKSVGLTVSCHATWSA